MTSTEIDLSRYKLGWSDAEDYVFKPKKGLNEDIVREMSEMKKEPEWMRDFRLRALKQLRAKPMAQWFAVNMPDLDFDDIYYYIKPTSGTGGGLGRPARRHQEHLREARHPRGRAQVPGRGHRPVRVRGRVPPQPRGPRGTGRPLLRHGHGGARVPRPRPQVVRHDHPAQRQQVRRPQLGGVVGRLVHLRAARCRRSTCRCRPTSGSTPRTWASSSGR